MLVLSTMLPLGTKAPDFNLPSAAGNQISLEMFNGSKGLLVLFICNHCPYVKHIKSKLISFADEYMPKGINIVGINSSDWESFPADHPDKMNGEEYPFPYLYDESQSVAKAYKAACTPDIFLFDGNMRLVYRGQFDDSRPGLNVPITGQDLKRAADAVLLQKNVFTDQRPASGCNIKWRKGNEPDYFPRSSS